MRTSRDLPTTAIDRLLAGEGAADAELEPLAGFVTALNRAVADTPTAPSYALAEVFSDGLEPLGSTYGLATAAPSRPARARHLARSLVTRFAAVGLFAKIGLGAAVAAAATTGAGAAGVLPAPVQDAVAGVVGTVTPFELPSSASDTARDAVERRGGPDAGGDEGATPAPSADFGQDVAEDATGHSDGEPGVDGRDIADEASDGRSSDLPDPAADGRDKAETNRLNAGERSDDAPQGPGEGSAEAEHAPDRADEHVPDQAEEHVPDDVPARPDQAPAEAPAPGRG